MSPGAADAGSNRSILDTNLSPTPATSGNHYSTAASVTPAMCILRAIVDRDGPRLEAMLKLHKAHVR